MILKLLKSIQNHSFILIYADKLYIWEFILDGIFPYNPNVLFSKTANYAVSVGILADNLNLYKALLSLSPVTDSSQIPLSVQLKIGLFNITMLPNGTVDYTETNNSITNAMLKIYNQEVYLIGQSYFPDRYLFSYIIDQLFQIGMCIQMQ